MAQVSRAPLKKEVYEEIVELLVKVVRESQREEEARALLEELLTPTERIMLAKRLGIALMLAKGYSYEEIREVLKVSKPTIGRVSLVLNYGEKGGYSRFVKRVMREEKVERFLNKVEDVILDAFSVSPSKGGSTWRAIRREVRKKRRRRML